MIGSSLLLAGPLAKGGEAVKAGPIGLGVILLLCIACYFLFKSMSKHMRKVRENFPAAGFTQHAQPPAQGPVQSPPQPTAASTPLAATDPPATH